jgi:pimeloyl-ACP methyl ester carboxylesterase
MRHANIIGGAVALGLLPAGPVVAAEWPDDCQEAALPSDDPNYPDAQLILTCLPSDFNGTLIVYAHEYVKPQEPLALPEEFGEADVRELIEQLLNLGFGVASSSYHKNGYAIEQAEADLNNLVAYVESIHPDVDTVYVLGGSEGGLIATMLVEKYPETYAGGLALCGPLAGTSFQVAHLADVRVLFDYFYPEVFPFGALDVPDDAAAQDRCGDRSRSRWDRAGVQCCWRGVRYGRPPRGRQLRPEHARVQRVRDERSAGHGGGLARQQCRDGIQRLCGRWRPQPRHREVRCRPRGERIREPALSAERPAAAAPGDAAYDW